MGRDMYTVIKDVKTDKVIWASCELDYITEYAYDHDDISFRGRYEETNAIALLCDEELDQCDITTDKSFDMVYNRLREIADDNHRLRIMLQDRLDDIREARRHAVDTEKFCEFTELYEQWERDYHDEYWYRAEDMQQLMATTHAKFISYKNKLGDAVDLHMYWVNDE